MASKARVLLVKVTLQPNRRPPSSRRGRNRRRAKMVAAPAASSCNSRSDASGSSSIPSQPTRGRSWGQLSGTRHRISTSSPATSSGGTSSTGSSGKGREPRHPGLRPPLKWGPSHPSPLPTPFPKGTWASGRPKMGTQVSRPPKMGSQSSQPPPHPLPKGTQASGSP